MLKFIPQSCKKILEIGCGVGNFAKELMAMKNIEVWGVEPHKEASETAKNIMHNVINDYYTSEIKLPNNYFDCIIFNDVLEHLIEPWNTLAFTKNFLRKDTSSYVVASIPNFLYIRNVYELLIEKDFRYKGEGTLDITHLRFFTLKSILRLFDEAGYIIEEIKGINPSTHLIFRTLNFLFLNQLKSMKYCQYAVVAKTKNME